MLSETDEKRIIRFANDEFCQFAEYSLDELIGKPQYRKTSDMPKAAFEDLWKTVKVENLGRFRKKIKQN